MYLFSEYMQHIDSLRRFCNDLYVHICDCPSLVHLCSSLILLLLYHILHWLEPPLEPLCFSYDFFSQPLCAFVFVCVAIH